MQAFCSLGTIIARYQLPIELKLSVCHVQTQCMQGACMLLYIRIERLGSVTEQESWLCAVGWITSSDTWHDNYI